MSEVSDAWQKGFETANSAVRKLADKELAKLRAENERLRANPWALFADYELRNMIAPGVIPWKCHAELARREALKGGKP